MTRHGRKNGDKESHPIPLWNGVFEHYGRIGDALWEFAWCIDRITEERDGVGIVLGGSPVKLRAIVETLKGSNRETVRRHLDSLERENYIRRRRTPYGHVIEVLNSRKFGIWQRSKEKPQNDVSLGVEKHGFVQEKPKSVQEKHGFVVYKEDSAGTQQEDAAVKHAAGGSEFWNLIGVSAQRMPPDFRSLCEALYSTKNGQSLGEFMGVCMDGWEALGAKRQPREFVQAANAIRGKEKNPPPPPINYLPEVPFRARTKGESCQKTR